MLSGLFPSFLSEIIRQIIHIQHIEMLPKTNNKLACCVLPSLHRLYVVRIIPQPILSCQNLFQNTWCPSDLPDTRIGHFLPPNRRDLLISHLRTRHEVGYIIVCLTFCTQARINKSLLPHTHHFYKESLTLGTHFHEGSKLAASKLGRLYSSVSSQKYHFTHQ